MALPSENAANQKKWLILPVHNSMRQTVEAVTGQNIPSALATPVPQAPKPVVKEDWANCSGHKETLNSSKKRLRYGRRKTILRILLKQNTALLSHVCVSVRHRRDISRFLNNLIV